MKTYLIPTSHGLVALDECIISWLVELWLAKGGKL